MGEASSSALQALSLGPSSRTYDYLGRVCKQDGRRDESLYFYEMAIEFNPTNDRVYTNLGNLYASTQQWQNAKKNYFKALQNKPNQVQTYQNLGSMLGETGMLNEAEA